MTVEYIGNGNPDGTIIGLSSTELLGFYGITTPVARPAITAITTATATTTLNETRIGRLEAALVSLGLLTTDG